MRYIFRDITVFEYLPEKKKIKEHSNNIGFGSVFNNCGFIVEDYKLLSEFFDRAYRHAIGEAVDLSDIEVY